MTRSSRGAFALVDVVVGSILLGISLAVVIGLSGQAVSSARRGQELATAAMLADEQLKMVLARGPDDYARRFPAAGACDPPFGAYRFALAFAGGSASDPYRVSVTIRWAAGAGAREESLTIETLMASRSAGEEFDPDPERAPQEPVVRTP